MFKLFEIIRSNKDYKINEINCGTTIPNLIKYCYEMFRQFNIIRFKNLSSGIQKFQISYVYFGLLKNNK